LPPAVRPAERIVIVANAIRESDAGCGRLWPQWSAVDMTPRIDGGASMNRRTLLLAGGSVWLSAASAAYPSQKRKRQDDDWLDDVLGIIRGLHGIPALAGAAVVDGEVKEFGATGIRATRSPEKVTSNDKFHIGSCTKALTASLIALLVQQKKLRWDMPLSAALPNFAGVMLKNYRDVPLECLLCNRAGFPGETAPAGKSLNDVRALRGSTFDQRQAYVRMIVAQKPDAPPNTKFIYSNAGYVTAGAIAEHWTKKPWETAIKEMLFVPLGMRTGGFGPMATKGKRDQPWSHLGDGASRRAVPPGPGADNPLCIGPAGTVHCSIGDWAKFAAAQLGGEIAGKRLFTDETLAKLHTPIGDQEYAMGWNVAEREWGGGRVLNHAGSNTMNFAIAWLAPKKKFAALAATNCMGESATKACDEVATALIERHLRG
jgi:CubicO group peptidase (beta-lactamase class C family)